MDPVTAGGDDSLWSLLAGICGFLAVTLLGWIKLEMAGLRRDHNALDSRVDQAQRDIDARTAYCATNSANVNAFMLRIEAKLDRLVEKRWGHDASE